MLRAAVQIRNAGFCRCLATSALTEDTDQLPARLVRSTALETWGPVGKNLLGNSLQLPRHLLAGARWCWGWGDGSCC